MCCEFTYNECLYLGIGPTDQGVFVNSIAERFGKLENDWSKKSDG